MFTAIAAFSLALGGCAEKLETMNTGSAALSGGEMTGGSIGAAAGGAAAAVAGADPTGVVGGVIAGLALGATAGGWFDRERTASDTFSAIDSLDAGEARLWRNGDGGINRTAVDEVYVAADGAVCKRYTEERPATVGMTSHVGTACRKPDGDWQDATRG